MPPLVKRKKVKKKPKSKKPRKKDIYCIACGDTGVNSKGYPCGACRGPFVKKR